MSYSLMQRLGRGGMGVVDLAVDPAGRPVALKRLALRGSDIEIQQARQRVRREAEVLGALDHPNIVALLDVMDDGDDLVLVMPYLSGGTLADHVRTSGPMPPAAVAYLGDQLLGALAVAHRAGIVHRDIKPANVLFDASGRAYLTDFGVATMRGATSGLTAAEVVIGTPEYMAPEQARGERATAASDVFSMGATLRFAATGEPPFGRGDARVILNRAAAGKVEPVGREVPRDLRRSLDHMLDKRPERRPTAAAARGSAGDTQFLARPVRARRSTRSRLEPVRARRSTRSRLEPVLLTVASIMAVALLAAGVLAYTRSRQPESQAAPPASSPTTTAAVVTTTTAVPCTPLAYQPCGRPVAAFTNGRQCIDAHADYNTDPADGCEAAPDQVDGDILDHQLVADLVPATDVDRYPLPVKQRAHLFCDGTVRVTLTAPDGVSMRLNILNGTDVVDSATSTNGRPATATLVSRDCFTAHGDDLVAEVSWVGSARSGADYTLARAGAR